MKTLQELKSEALTSCIARGHSMHDDWTDFTPTNSENSCICCGRWVQVNSRPMPNEIDIGGPAVAITCGEELHCGLC